MSRAAMRVSSPPLTIPKCTIDGKKRSIVCVAVKRQTNEVHI